MKTKQQLIFLIVILNLSFAQKPCAQYEYDEMGCVSSTYEACQWNEFQSSCKKTFSTNIGCSSSLNILSCIRQMQYPDNEWSYCIFSGYCRDIQGVTDCLPNLSKPACMAVIGKACFWGDYCLNMTLEQLTSAVNQAQNNVTVMNESNIYVCQLIKGLTVMHQSGATQYLKKLVKTSDAALFEKYTDLLSIQGCLEVDANLLNLMTCTDAGINSVACQGITTSGQKCQFLNNECQNVEDVSSLNCGDILNKQACLSITKITQPCYWDGKCLRYPDTTQCDYDIFPVSPSFCASVDDDEQECFYETKKTRCSELCRSSNLLMNKKICNSSSHNCIYKNSTCLFKGVQSQCGIAGQNKYSCMSVSENCQFVNGICYSMKDLSTAKCTDNLNRQACMNVQTVGQICSYESETKQCLSIKLSSQDLCTDYFDVNENVCKRMTDQACYWNDGTCEVPGVNISCTLKGLNKIGCLASTKNQCSWNSALGGCQEITITSQTKCSTLTLVNAKACEKVQFQASNVYELCKYNEQTYSCETFIAEVAPLALYNINCSTSGLNRAGCLSVADPTIGCKWTANGCIQVTSVSASCSGLIGVTPKVCSLATGEPCTYNTNFQRCITNVVKNPDTCISTSVLNGQGCAFINPKNGAQCYFDSKTLSCLEATSAILSTLECVKSYPNKAACLAITTVGQRCSWNAQKYLCEQLKIPYVTYCEELENVAPNGCIGYEIDVDYYIDSDSYCTNGDTANTCKLFDPSTANNNCFAASSPNLHACVGLTSGQNCYFDTSLLKCTTMNTGQENILLEILCKQGNKDLCPRIKTKDQFCVWNDYQSKCQHYDQCTEASDQTGCAAVTQPCVFKDNSCILILSTNAINYECSDAANELACYYVAQNSCTYSGGACIELTQDLDNDTCTTYSSASQKVNAVSCAKITKTGEFCSYDGTNNQCVSNQITTYDQCSIGQNEQNCSYDNNCTFDSEKSLCKSISSICTNALTLDNCMKTVDTCMWTTANLCKYVPYDGTCKLYSTVGYKYNTQTCGSVYAEDDKANKICAQNPDTLLCEQIIPYKCSSTTDGIDCTNVRNKCSYNSTLKICYLSSTKPQKCSDNFTKFACLTGKLKCIWDIHARLCSDYSDEEVLCQTINNDGTISDAVQPTLSAEICYLSDCYLDLTTLGCTQYNSNPTTCTEAKSPYSCLSLPDEQYCYWDTDLTCKSLTDLSQGANLSYVQVQFSQKTVCLLPQQEGEYSQWKESNCIIPDNSSTLCTDSLNIKACQANFNADPIQYCIYKNGFCQIAILTTTLCSDFVNYYTCISITTPNQYCAWFGYSCANVNDDGYSLSKYTATNAYTCTRTYTINGAPNASIKNPLGVKFSLNGCVESEPAIDICTTPGLNYYGCLQTQADACVWNGSSCVKFTDYSGKLKCSDFQNISAGVCIQVDGLKCTWSNYNCIDAATNLQCTDNLSQAACVIQTSNSCKWENNKCQNQTIIQAITQCGQGNIYSTATYSSVLSCSQVEYGSLPCLHNGTGCTIEMDFLTMKCSTPGLNSVACTMIQLEKCIFQNGKCQVYYGNSQICKTLVAVSPQVCAEVTDTSQQCKYSQLSNKCTIVNSYDLCTSVGINQSGCSNLPHCKWHKDQNYCTCSSSLSGITFCADYDNAKCKIQSQCIIDNNSNSCRIRVCSDLNSQQCLNNTMNNEYCYTTKAGVCQSAKTCNDVRNVNDCTKIQINGITCQTHTQGICREFNCSDNLTDATCNGNCIWVGTYCDQRVCQQFGKQNQCNGTYNNNTCFWFNNMCFGLGSCSELVQFFSDETALENACTKSIINGNQCYWQLVDQYSNTYECSQNQCRYFFFLSSPFGSSKINCYGAEINKYVCVLSHDFQCLRCEDVTDKCECQQQVGNCVYENNKCQSVQCIDYEQSSCELYTDKCVWYKDKCLIVCSKLDEDACMTRNAETNQCYWETQLKKCNPGQQSAINRDTVAVQIQEANITITVSILRGKILTLAILIQLLF